MKRWARYALEACILTVLVYGCGAQPARPAVDARSAPGGLDVRGGATLTPADLAYGGGPWIDARGVSDARREATVDLDPFLKPEAVASAQAKPSAPATPREPARAPAPALPSTAPPAALAASKPEQLAVAEEQPLARAPLAPNSDLERYGQRERQSRELQSYRGGDAVVISASTLVIVLLVVLLVVLLT